MSSSRGLGGLETYCARWHDHHNMNITLALTIHTRAALDLGIVQITLQELQHQHPQLTARIRREAGRETFQPMELPVLPLDQELACTDMLHSRFDTETGPLWRVQIITRDTFQTAGPALGFGPEVEAIIEDDSSLDTRWRYFLRYLQGCLNQDIDNFENSLTLEEEGRSVVVMTFHPAVTDTTGAFYLAKQFMEILDVKLENDGPLSGGEQEDIPNSVENLLPQPATVFHLTDLVPMVNSVKNQLFPWRKSPLDPELREVPESPGRSQFLRGWLTEEETREVLARCQQDEISLHGVILAAGLQAMARICRHNNSQQLLTLRASVLTNLRQFCSPPAPRHGVLSAPYEENFSVAATESTESEEFWQFAQTITMSHNTAKSSRAAVRTVRHYGNLLAGGETLTAFNNVETSRRVSAEMSCAVHGDLGNIFRRESQSSPYESWTGQPLQVKLEDVFPMVAAQNLGSPVSHTAHIYQGRLNYILGYFTTYIDTNLALRVRDETINILRMAVMEL